MNVAFIPVRGGSRSIPLKNIKLLAGHPLVYWTAKAACACQYIDKVFICTDSDDIRRTAKEFKTGKYLEDTACFQKIEVIPRSAESASDAASTESVMLEFAGNYDFDNIALVQATSPLLQAADLDAGFETYNGKDTDSVMSVVCQNRFNWAYGEDGNIYPTNYDVFHRPRRQESAGYLVENGAFYITSRERLLSSKNRVSGKIKAVEMHPDTFFELDEPSDWRIVEELMFKRQHGETARPGKCKDKIKAPGYPEIKMLLTDVDGCLTDGGMYYSEKGDELKKFNARDGMGFKMLRERKILTGIVTSESVGLNRRRAEKLKLDIFIGGSKDKAEAIKKLSRQYKVPLKNICYIGDDINDAGALKMAGFGCCPSDAEDSVKQAADFIAASKGGCGVIREIADMLTADNSCKT